MAVPVGKAHPFPRAVEHENESSRENQKMELGVLDEGDLRNAAE
jgi:hypothetical protein